MREIESGVKKAFSHLREQSIREIYFYNAALSYMYAGFIRVHPGFFEEITPYSE